MDKVATISNSLDGLSSSSSTEMLLVGNFYQTLKDMNFHPTHIVDVGANRGYWTRKVVEVFPDATITMIEPQEKLSSYFPDLLDKPNITFLSIGLGNKNTNATFTIHKRDDSCSFAYSSEDATKRGFEQIQVPIKTLDTVISENNLSIPDIVKIDAEGFDFEVLEGCSNLFGKTEVFMVEASVKNKFYKNSVLKMMNFMNEKGYELFDITDLNRPFKPSILWLVELVFVKKDGIIANYEIVR